MRTAYTDLDFKLHIDATYFHVLNIAFEQFSRPIPKHSHGTYSYEVHYISEGYGKVCIDNQVYHVTPNTLYITGPHVEHEQIPYKENPMEEYCLYFKLQKSSFPPMVQENTTTLFENTPFWFGQDTQDLYPIFKQIFSELKTQYTGYRILVESLLQQCIVKLVRNYQEETQETSSIPTSNLVDSKYLIVEESFLYNYENITLKTLSQELGLSIRQTERFLKEHYGKTFLQKKTEAKMSVARIYLNDPAITITEIARRLNYSSIEHFSYAFRQYYGISASAYRKKLIG